MRRGLTLICLALCAGALLPATASAKPSLFRVGAAKEDVTPSDLTGFYLGGYGIGPTHEARSVLRHIYFRVIAIRDRQGHQVVVGTLDSQGYSVAYQNGPFGFSDIENYAQGHLGIPASHIILQATHSHNGPDEIGVWGGVPDAYLAWVTKKMEAGIRQAVVREQPAVLKVGTADMTGFSGTFGSNTDPTNTGDNQDYPMDQQLRVLQALTPNRRAVLATLVNYSTHATVYGPRNQVAPDWPGSTATYLEHTEIDMPAGASYGYPGSTAVVTVGAMGHTWPAGIPSSDTDPGVQPVDQEKNLAPDGQGQNNWEADVYGNAVAQRAIDAVSAGHGFFINGSQVRGTSRNVRVENTNPVLLAAANEPANPTPLGGYKIDRSTTPPWGYGDVFVSPVTTLRVGGIPFYAVPGEPYPSIKFSLNQGVHAPVQFLFGLANDQLGYAEELSDYNGAFQCSTTDEWFFTISPIFGSDVVRLSQANAKELGLTVTGSTLKAYRPGQVPPSANCTEQQVDSGSGPIG
ncbi:MAG: hypothetical protein ACJ764_08635 [Solirubrobacteraceae bacterium]